MRKLPLANTATSKFSMAMFSNMVSAQRGMFSQTRIALPCRVDPDDDGYTYREREDLREKISGLEVQLCQSRSILAKAWFLIRDQHVKISPQLKNSIIQELEKQRRHRMEDNESETEKTSENLDDINREIQRGRNVLEHLQALQEKKMELEKTLKALKEEDPNSDAFLDRDSSPYGKKP